MFGISPYHPVVPTTMFLPSDTQAPMLSRTQCGPVKSTTTSMLAVASFVKPDPLGFSASRRTSTACPRSRATSATSEPVLPIPRRRSFMDVKSNLCAGTRARAPAPRISCENLRIQLRKKPLVQALNHPRHLLFINHKGQIDLRGALRNHANLHVGKLAKYVGCDSRDFTQIFAYQTHDCLPTLILDVCKPCQICCQGRDRLVRIHRQRNADLRS